MKKHRTAMLLCLIIGIPLLILGGCFAATFPLSVNFIFGTHFSHSIKEEIKGARELAQLAEFPQSATDIKGYDWTNFFAGDVYLKFTAPQEDIQAFLQGSPGLEGVEPEPLDGHMMTSYFEGISWFTPDTQNSVVYDAKDAFTYVAVDNTNNTVYIFAVLD